MIGNEIITAVNIPPMKNELPLETITNKRKTPSVENADQDESGIPLSVNYHFTRK